MQFIRPELIRSIIHLWIFKNQPCAVFVSFQSIIACY